MTQTGHIFQISISHGGVPKQAIFSAEVDGMGVAGWLLLLLGLPGSLTVGIWWASILSALITLGYVIWYWRFRSQIPTERFERIWIVIVGRRAARVLGFVFRLDWLYRLIAALLQLFQRFLQVVTTILEGEGGAVEEFKNVDAVLLYHRRDFPVVKGVVRPVDKALQVV